MTPQKQKEKLSSQTSIAQKVFQFVPIQESWTIGQIAESMYRITRSRVDVNVIKSCLMRMSDAGLLVASAGGVFTRVGVKAEATNTLSTQKEKKTLENKTEHKPTNISPIELLAGIAKSVRALASEIEAAAIAIDEARSSDQKQFEQLRQLKDILKGLG